jgi:hypothetical protein
MNWQKELRRLERNKQWDQAIIFMQDTITQYPDSLDAYLSMSYLLMNLLLEEVYDLKKQDYYLFLTKKYYDESYEKFFDDPKYLFYEGVIISVSDWLFERDVPSYPKMFLEACRLDPKNILYLWGYYMVLDKKNPGNRKKTCEYARAVLDPNSPIPKMLPTETSLGKYILELITYWSKRMLETGAIPE